MFLLQVSTSGVRKENIFQLFSLFSVEWTDAILHTNRRSEENKAFVSVLYFGTSYMQTHDHTNTHWKLIRTLNPSRKVRADLRSSLKASFQQSVEKELDVERSRRRSELFSIRKCLH